MNESKKSRGQLLGEAVCGFANSQTTDEACFAILTGVQQTSGFSSSFKEEVEKVFPAIGNIEPPPKNIREELKEINYLEDKALSSLREELGPPLELSCNRPNQSIIIRLLSSKIDDFWKLPPSKRFPFLDVMRTPSGLEILPIDFDKPLLSHEKFGHLNEVYLATASEVYKAEATASSKPYDQSIIDDLKNAELHLQESWTRYNTIELHNVIQIQQKIVRELLDHLIRDRHLGLDGRFLEYLQTYNKMPRSRIEFDQQGNLFEVHPIREEDYFRINLPSKWLDRVKSDLAYCLIEFLRSEYKKNLKRCDVCSNFFVHPTSKRCSDDCTQKAKKTSDRDYKRFMRWEQFVDDVKEKCKTIDDLNNNPKLLTRASRFHFGRDEAIERLKEAL